MSNVENYDDHLRAQRQEEMSQKFRVRDDEQEFRRINADQLAIAAAMVPEVPNE